MSGSQGVWEALEAPYRKMASRQDQSAHAGRAAEADAGRCRASPPDAIAVATCESTRRRNSSLQWSQEPAWIAADRKPLHPLVLGLATDAARATQPC